MRAEYGRFILTGTAIGGLIAMVLANLDGASGAGRAAALVGMAVGATVGLWVIRAVDDSPEGGVDQGDGS